MAEQRTEPEYRVVTSEAGLLNLIPGDRVDAKCDKIYEMVCKGIDHGEGNDKLNEWSKISLIQVPQDYSGEEDAEFILWESYIKYLQFGDGTYILSSRLGIYIDHFHKSITPVKPGSEQHKELKTLVDMLA